MKRAIDAIYENGAFRRLQPDAIAMPEALRLAAHVYDGPSSEGIKESEQVALDRGDFFGRRSAD
jgi:predicted DNA-binding antitoxin AbrB/MazE fold protein